MVRGGKEREERGSQEKAAERKERDWKSNERNKSRCEKIEWNRRKVNGRNKGKTPYTTQPST